MEIRSSYDKEWRQELLIWYNHRYHGCWWPGNARGQVISREMDLLCTEYSVACQCWTQRRLNESFIHCYHQQVSRISLSINDYIFQTSKQILTGSSFFCACAFSFSSSRRREVSKTSRLTPRSMSWRHNTSMRSMSCKDTGSKGQICRHNDLFSATWHFKASYRWISARKMQFQHVRNGFTSFFTNPSIFRLSLTVLQLTHWDQVMVNQASIGLDNGLSRQVVAWSAPKHHLNQCWHISSTSIDPWDHFFKNLNQNTIIFSHQHLFENVTCKMVTIFSWPQWVKESHCMLGRSQWINYLC